MPSNDNDFVDPTKAVLQPRNPGEQLKIKETVLKRRDRNLQAKRRNADKIQAERAKKQEALKTEKLVTPAKLIKRSLTRKKDKNRMKRLNKGPQKHLRVDNAKNGKVIVAIRNKRTSPMPKVESVLKKLRLTDLATLVFLPYTEKTLLDLKTCEPFLFWGFPDFKTVNDLLHKKAMFQYQDASGKVEKVLLSSNELLEKHLGSVGILCVEDLIAAIFSGGEEGCFEDGADGGMVEGEEFFKVVTNKLCPLMLGDFSVEKAEGFHIETKYHHFGPQGKKISKLVKEVL